VQIYFVSEQSSDLRKSVTETIAFKRPDLMDMFDPKGVSSYEQLKKKVEANKNTSVIIVSPNRLSKQSGQQVNLAERIVDTDRNSKNLKMIFLLTPQEYIDETKSHYLLDNGFEFMMIGEGAIGIATVVTNALESIAPSAVPN